MIAFLTLCYTGVLALLVWLKILPNTLWTWLTTVVWFLLLFVVLFIPMQWGAPSGSARILTYSVQIIPNVAGPVVEVPVQPNTILKKGDVLFQIDPAPYRAAVDGVRAQLNYQKLRLDQYRKLASRQAGTRFQVEETEARIAQLEAQLDTAEWNLRETTVRAPTDGYVTYLALRPGQRVVTLPLQPAMTFIDTSRKIVGVQIEQIYQRHLAVDQPVEIAFKTRPGRIYTGTVSAVIQVTHDGQTVISGTVPPAERVEADPFFVRVELDENQEGDALPAGTVGTAAIYTDSASMTHIIRKVMLRMESFVNYVVPRL
ncbi:MAG: HlyD family secretion protein [Hyphomicrobiaceae bacterium]